MLSCSRPCLITSGAILDVMDDQHANQLYSSKNVGWEKKSSDNVAKNWFVLAWFAKLYTFKFHAHVSFGENPACN